MFASFWEKSKGKVLKIKLKSFWKINLQINLSSFCLSFKSLIINSTSFPIELSLRISSNVSFLKFQARRNKNNARRKQKKKIAFFYHSQTPNSDIISRYVNIFTCRRKIINFYPPLSVEMRDETKGSSMLFEYGKKSYLTASIPRILLFFISIFIFMALLFLQPRKTQNECFF